MTEEPAAHIINTHLPSVSYFWLTPVDGDEGRPWEEPESLV